MPLILGFSCSNGRNFSVPDGLERWSWGIGKRKKEETVSFSSFLHYHSFAMDVMALQMVVVYPDHRHHSHRLMVSPELGQELVGFQSENRYCD